MASYISPLIGYENAPPLPTTVNADGKSLTNLPNEDGKLSEAYEKFVKPIDSSNNGFDFHGELHLRLWRVCAFRDLKCVVRMAHGQSITCRAYLSNSTSPGNCMRGFVGSFQRYIRF